MSNKLVAIYLLGIAFMMYGCSSEKRNEGEGKRITVKTTTIGYTSSEVRREYIGEVEGENEVDVSFQVNGNIEKVYVQEGQSVQKGQLLARLNTTSLQSIYDAAKSTLVRAQDAYDRLSILYKNNSLPEIKYVEVQTALEQSRSAERLARKNLSECSVYAPFSGLINKRYVEAGTNVLPGSPIYNLVSIHTVKVKVAIPEQEISGMKNGQTCHVKISALNNESFDGVIVEKGVSAHPVSHTYNIKVKLANKNLDIMPGMVCKVYVSGNPVADSRYMLIPLRAAQLDRDGKHFVWLKDKENKVIRQEIVLGRLVGNEVVVTQGLQEGDLLITEGYQHVSPGITVTESN
ncbi:efflux RND transporter periplasmic adaptor subunit [Bacteroides reticulotermitis]|nr:efflux RND transporter periplasmic adaptor subunit [Bacteroides reticulotermitis]MBB4046292.1 RND family efflux transporter MFP subunit [Bacteroides reticulotermitis]